MDFKNEFQKLLEDILDIDLKDHIEIPPNIDLGDYAFPVFFLSKKFKKSPKDISKDILEKLKDINQDIFEFSESSGYINAKIKPFLLFTSVIKEVIDKGEDYGKISLENKQYVIDTFQPNPLKMLHIGHIRNAVVGESIYRLLKFTNQDPIPVSYMGDIGTHIAKWLWYYKSLSPEKQVIPKKDVSRYIGKIYLDAGSKLRENPDFKKEIDELQVRLMTEKKLQDELKRLIDISFKDYMKVKSELDITLKENFFESQSEHRFNQIRAELFKKYPDIFKESEGAIVADLKDKELGNFILIKQNGALLYGAKDVGLLDLKLEKFPNCKNFLYVVASEQDFYFKQLFKLFSIIYPNIKNKHISYGLVSLSSGKMKSRSGEIVFYEDLRDILFKKVNDVLEKNGIDFDESIVRDISFGTIKFELLKIGINKNLLFDIKSATDLQGDSAPYIQYNAVRAKSIIKKSNIDLSLDLLNTKNKLEKEEIELIKHISLFKEKVLYATKEYKPNIIASYCISLSRIFSKFYTTCTVMHQNKDIRNNRFLLVKSFLTTIENALYILGIKVPERM